MEPINHPFRKDNDLPNLHDHVPCLSSRVYLDFNKVASWLRKNPMGFFTEKKNNVFLVPIKGGIGISSI